MFRSRAFADRAAQDFGGDEGAAPFVDIGRCPTRLDRFGRRLGGEAFAGAAGCFALAGDGGRGGFDVGFAARGLWLRLRWRGLWALLGLGAGRR